MNGFQIFPDASNIQCSHLTRGCSSSSYHTSTFGYDIPVSQDGPYVLVLKFCEVYFDAPGQKVTNLRSQMLESSGPSKYKAPE